MIKTTNNEYICNDCPRMCSAVRKADSGHGFCRCGYLPSVVRAAPHFGEEPCISGTKGSGAIFFSGCNLRCVFCQNHEISRSSTGKQVSVQQLQEIILNLQDTGVHNINLVTPTHYTRIIAEALSGIYLDIPVVWNSSGYDSVESLKMLEGLVQIYMPDLKYWDSSLAQKYSAAPDYREAASAAIKEMYRQTGPYALDDNGIMKSGVLIRHLILPQATENSMDVIDFVADSFQKGSVLFSLMSQYTPMVASDRFPELMERIDTQSYESLKHYMTVTRRIEDGYWQDAAAATTEMIPDFDMTGL